MIPAALQLALALGAASAWAQPAPTFPSGVELVRLDVVVTDGEGRPVTGLTATDFAVEENGQPRRIESFEPIVVHLPVAPGIASQPLPTLAAVPRTHAPEEGRCVLFFLDDVHLASSTAQQLRLHLVPFVERELREGDWVTVVAPQAHVWWTARTAWERAQLPAVLGRIGGQYSRDPFRLGISEYGAMEAVERSPGPHGGSLGGLDDIGRNVAPEEVYAVTRRRISTTLRALRDAVASLTSFRGHKSLVFYSQGFVLAPRFPEFDEIAELARRANVAVHFLDPRGLASGCGQAEDRAYGECKNPASERLLAAAGAISIAQATGGRETLSNDPVLEVHRILEESQAYYLIGHGPLQGRSGERKVRVRVLRDSLKVLARTRYVVVSANALGAMSSPEIAALHSVSDATDLSIRAEVRLPEPVGLLPSARPLADGRRPLQSVPIAVAVPAESRTLARRLSVLIEARPRDRGEPVVDQAEVTLPPDSPDRFERILRLAPGVWQARVVVREIETGRLGSVLLTFEVPSARATP